ncbi:hypothetical protein ACP2W0_10480 [Pseudobacillus badius]|uniref:hypothetical protein n=1 Tax=Bacillus badius TaxID=1455 RepID=UPI000F73661A|nr:hypothetical protein [Bacillus badius]MED0666982.1 hypothetical protein [Bacillus badius]UAT31506.1 hypothetical protein K7T73_04530 [Bacillus badius]
MLNVLLYSLAGRHFQSAWLFRPSIMFLFVLLIMSREVDGKTNSQKAGYGGINLYKAGVWVKIKNRNAIGFVLEASYHGAMVFVIRNGKPAGEHRYSYHQLTLMNDELTTEELLDLARLTVDLNQKEWFMEVTERMKEKSGG